MKLPVAGSSTSVGLKSGLTRTGRRQAHLASLRYLFQKADPKKAPSLDSFFPKGIKELSFRTSPENQCKRWRHWRRSDFGSSWFERGGTCSGSGWSPERVELPCTIRCSRNAEAPR